MYIDTLQRVLSSTNKILLDYKGSGNLLYLPLDKLLKQTGTAPEAETPPAPPETTPETSSSDVSPRSRDLLRSRERGERP